MLTDFEYGCHIADTVFEYSRSNADNVLTYLIVHTVVEIHFFAFASPGPRVFKLFCKDVWVLTGACGLVSSYGTSGLISTNPINPNPRGKGKE